MTETTDPLVEAARAARLRAHAPYSRFLVGCAVEGVNGQIALGANMENASYRLGLCAEQAALAAAQQAFGLGAVRRIAIVGGPAEGEGRVQRPVTPCGGCRQALAEAAAVAGRTIAVVCASVDGSAVMQTSSDDLLPDAFTLE